MHGEDRRPVFPARRPGGCHRFRTSTCSIFICPQCTHRTPRRGPPTRATCTGSSTPSRRRSTWTACSGPSSTSSPTPSTATPASSTWSSPTPRWCCARCPIRTPRSSAGSGSSRARGWPDGWPSTTSRCSSPKGRSPTREPRSCPRPRRTATSRSSPSRLRGKAGEVIGVISLHSEAPREFTQDDSDFMMHAASLVAGAIENARLYERTRRRLALVEGLADLSRAVSGASTLEQLLPAVARRAQRLLHAEACEVFVASGADGRFRRGAAWPDAPGHRHAAHRGRGRRRAGPGRGRRRRRPPHGGAPVGCGRRWPGPGRPAGRRRRAGRRARPAHVGAAPDRPRGARAGRVDRRPDRGRDHERPHDRAADRAQRHQGLPRGPLGRPHARRRPARARPRRCGVDIDQPHVVLLAVPRSGPATRSLGRRRPRARGRRRPRVSRVALRPPRRRRARARAPRVARRGPRRGAACARSTPGSTRTTRSRSASRSAARARRARAPASRRPSTPSPRRRS